MATEVFPKRPVSRPHTEITSDTSGIGGSSSGSEKLLMLIGSAAAGDPATAYVLKNYQQAKSVFRSGALLDAMELAWNPDADSSLSAGDILAVRVEDATQGTLTVGGLKFTSDIYGIEANDIEIALEDNTITGTKRLHLVFANDNIDQTYDNLGKIFKVVYSGDESDATITVAVDSITKKAATLTLSTTDGTTPTVVKEYKLTSGLYADINSIITDINNLPDFDATFFPVGDKNISPLDLEAVAAQSIKGTEFYLESFAGDIQKQIAYNGYVTLEIDLTKTVTNFPLTNLTGGTAGTVPQSWASKLNLFANEGGYYLVPLTDSQTVHSEVLAFVKERTDSGEPMRAIVGGGQRESIQQVISRATRLKDSRVALVGFSGVRAMDDGRDLVLPSYMGAAQIAGYACALDIGEALTFKKYAITSVDTIYTSDELDTLTESGVISLEFVRNRATTFFRIPKDVTTYNTTDEPFKNEMSVGEEHDFLVSDLKLSLDNQFIGSKVVETSASIIKSFIQTFLDAKKLSEEIQGYPADDVQVILQNDEASISFTVYPIRSLNKISVALTYSTQTLTA